MDRSQREHRLNRSLRAFRAAWFASQDVREQRPERKVKKSRQIVISHYDHDDVHPDHRKVA